MGKLIGWQTRIWDTKTWHDGRIVLCGSYTNRHTVQMNDKISGLDKEQCIVWLRLAHEVSIVSCVPCVGGCRPDTVNMGFS